MNKIELVERTLHAIAKDVAVAIPYVNCGGCGVYATELAKRLYRIGVRNFRIRTYTYAGDPDRKTNIKFVERHVFGKALPERVSTWNANGINFDHVRLQWNGTMWDADGAVSRKDGRKWSCYILHPGHISLKAINKICKDSSGWNSRFPRDDIPKMRRIMNRHFAKLMLDIVRGAE